MKCLPESLIFKNFGKNLFDKFVKLFEGFTFLFPVFRKTDNRNLQWHSRTIHVHTVRSEC